MNKHRLWKHGLLASAAIASLTVWGLAAGPRPVAPSAPASNQAVSAIRGVLHLAPFRLESAYPFRWSDETPLVDAGYLVVLDVDPARFVPRQGLEPVLQYGPQTVERVNQAHHHGRLVGIVPAVAGPDGWPAVSLEGMTPFLGPPALPEQVRKLDAAAAWSDAQSQGLPLGLGTPALAPSLELGDYGDLLRAAADLIREHSPAETGLADTLSMPILRRR